jgi:hypothetical protein
VATFFPKQTVHWHFEEPTMVRRFSLSLAEMAVLTGIVLRLYRAVVLPYGPTSWLYLGGALVLGILLLCAMTTAHLANFTVKRWLWRAPVFALVEVAAESATSLLLIWFGREPRGSARAEWSDWLPMAADTLWTRELVVCLWALFLAGAVFIVRRTMVHEPIEEESAEA